MGNLALSHPENSLCSLPEIMHTLPTRPTQKNHNKIFSLTQCPVQFKSLYLNQFSVILDISLKSHMFFVWTGLRFTPSL